MTWNFIDFSNYGISGKIIENFKSDEMIKTRVIMKDNSGKKLLKINSTKEKTYTIGISFFVLDCAIN